MITSIVRIIADASGASHFSDAVETLLFADFAPPAPLLGVSPSRNATSTCFIGAPAGWDSEPHPAPSIRWIVILRGTVEVRTTDGEVRRFAPGDAVHLEDTTGPGHATRVLPGDDWLAFVAVE